MRRITLLFVTALGSASFPVAAVGQEPEQQEGAPAAEPDASSPAAAAEEEREAPAAAAQPAEEGVTEEEGRNELDADDADPEDAEMADAPDESPPVGYELRVGEEAAAPQVERWIRPYVAIAGGLRVEDLALRPDQTRQSRALTVAVSRFGLRGAIGDHVRFVSEFEANLGGPLGYGASVWEGQAQMSVRDQYLQYNRAGFSLAAGRITDTATVDFFSEHVAGLLATDFYVREPLLFSGYDRGTGLYGKYEIVPGLRAGLTFHATNPTGISGTLLIGGELFPYDRPFYVAAAAVGRSEFMQPDTNLHIYFLTPSVEYEDEFFAFRSAAQGYVLDTDMSTDEDERILGYNLRASARVKLLDETIVPFLNASRNENELLAPQDQTVKLEDTYAAYTVSGGVDLNYWDRGGLGIQYARLRQRRGDGSFATENYVNIGHTFWIDEGLSAGLRYSAFMRDETNQESTASLLGIDGVGGHQSVFATTRLVY